MPGSLRSILCCCPIDFYRYLGPFFCTHSFLYTISWFVLAVSFHSSAACLLLQVRESWAYWERRFFVLFSAKNFRRTCRIVIKVGFLPSLRIKETFCHVFICVLRIINKVERNFEAVFGNYVVEKIRSGRFSPIRVIVELLIYNPRKSLFKWKRLEDCKLVHSF
jgi:hypothetical protein